MQVKVKISDFSPLLLLSLSLSVYIFIGFQSYSPILPAFLIKNVGKEKMNFQILTVFLRMEILKVTQVLEISTQNPIATVFRVSIYILRKRVFWFFYPPPPFSEPPLTPMSLRNISMLTKSI